MSLGPRWILCINGVMGGSRKLHDLYSSPSIIRIVEEDEVGRSCGTNGEEEEHV
jgi:hypothetical protein